MRKKVFLSFAGILLSLTAFGIALRLGLTTFGIAQSESDLTPQVEYEVLISDVPRMDLEEFKRLLAEDSIFVIDARSQVDYEEGHIPGAVMMPLKSVEARLSELRNIKKPVVTYCS